MTTRLLFKSFFAVIVVAALLFINGSQPNSTQFAQAANGDWARADNNAFASPSGMAGTPKYVNLINFKNTLYAIVGYATPGTTKGIIVWKHNVGNTWTQITPTGFNEGMNPLAGAYRSLEFKGKVYILAIDACNLKNGGILPNNCRVIWSSSDMTNWTESAAPNFGYKRNPVSVSIGGLIEYQGTLVASGFDGLSHGGGYGGALAFKSDTNGENWIPAYTGNNITGIGGTLNAGAAGGDIVALGKYLFVGAGSPLDNPTAIYRTSSDDGYRWSQVSPNFGARYPLGRLIEFGGILYGAFDSNDHQGFYIYKSSDGATWNQSSNLNFGEVGKNSMPVFFKFGTRLYAGTQSSSLYYTEDGITWTQEFSNINSKAIWTLAPTADSKLCAGMTSDSGAEVWCQKVGSGQITQPTLRIDLPPSAIVSPNQFQWNDSSLACSFTDNSKKDAPKFTGGGYCDHIIVTNELNKAGNLHYVITVAPIVKGSDAGFSYIKPMYKLADFLHKRISIGAYSPPPASNIFWIYKNSGPNGGGDPKSWGYKLTYQKVNANDAVALAGDDTAKYGDGTCANDLNGSYLCLATTTLFYIPEFEGKGIAFKPTQTLQHALALNRSLLKINGNISAGGTITGFTIGSPDALILGGTIRVQGDAKIYEGYNRSDAIKAGLIPDFTKIYSDTTFSSSDAKIASSNINKKLWDLNSAGGTSGTEIDAIPTTFSTPPEGKVWKVDGSVNFPDNFTFKGSGTVIIKGNATFSGAIKCDADSTTRLGLIVSGSITFGSNNIDCGAYIATGGDIIFSSNKAGAAKGIFITSQNIQLPKIDPKSNTQVTIDPDTMFSANPTIIFIDALKILSSTSS